MILSGRPLPDIASCQYLLPSPIGHDCLGAMPNRHGPNGTQFGVEKLALTIKQWRAEQVKIMIFGPEVSTMADSDVGAEAPTSLKEEPEATTS